MLLSKNILVLNHDSNKLNFLVISTIMIVFITESITFHKFSGYNGFICFFLNRRHDSDNFVIPTPPIYVNCINIHMEDFSSVDRNKGNRKREIPYKIDKNTSNFEELYFELGL